MAVNWALVPSSVQLRVPSVLPGTKQIALNESFSGYDIAVCYEGAGQGELDRGLAGGKGQVRRNIMHWRMAASL